MTEHLEAGYRELVPTKRDKRNGHYTLNILNPIGKKGSRRRGRTAEALALFEPYHDAEDRREGREGVVARHLDGWSVKAIASHLEVSTITVYRTIARWLKRGD